MIMRRPLLKTCSLAESAIFPSSLRHVNHSPAHPSNLEAFHPRLATSIPFRANPKASGTCQYWVGICFVCLVVVVFFSAIWSLHNLSSRVSHVEKTVPTHSMCHSWKLKSYFCLVQLRAGPNSWLIKGVLFALILYFVKKFVRHSPILEKMHGVVNAEQLNLLTVQISVCLNFQFKYIIR